MPTAGGALGLPGFEAVYGVAGLLVVAYLVMRRRQQRKSKVYCVCEVINQSKVSQF